MANFKNTGLDRADPILEIADQLLNRTCSDCLLIGIDGPDASGKSTFADQLASVLQSSSPREVIRISLDNFHNDRQVRYQSGRASAAGYWRHAFNLRCIVSNVLQPLKPGGSRSISLKSYDLENERPVDKQDLEWRKVEPGSIVIIDGVFLQRKELKDFWDAVVFLTATLEIRQKRMVARGDVRDVSDERLFRYAGAHAIYDQTCWPETAATFLIDTSDFKRVVLLRG